MSSYDFFNISLLSIHPFNPLEVSLGQRCSQTNNVPLEFWLVIKPLNVSQPGWHCSVIEGQPNN